MKVGEIRSQESRQYDITVLCTYATLNKFLKNYPQSQREYRFQVCEKPVAKLPDSFKDRSIVIFDGPFLALDPYGKTGFHLMTHVKHAVHSENIGLYPKIDKKLLSVIDKGIVKSPLISRFDLFIKAAKEFIPEIKDVEHIGSMFTVKTVLPYMEETDIRPTLIQLVDKKLIFVLGGKIVTCVNIAKKLSELADRM